VIAYILNRNGIVPADAVMDAETLPAVRMPAQDRFVPDDRQGGTEVR
jgi:cytochrome c